jgi:hypothetical protein
MMIGKASSVVLTA